MKGNITLTMKEERTNNILVKLINHDITLYDAEKLLGLSKRQILRKKKRYLSDGIISIIHKSKGKSNGKGYGKEFKEKIHDIYITEYNGWNFYHFNDTLEDFNNIKVSDTYIYNLLTSYGIKSPRAYKCKKKKSHPPRERKEYAGELIQVDASKHKWFDNDDNYYHLHGAIDDSTGIITGCHFEKEETIHGYQMVLMHTFKDYGIPKKLYTDFRTVFKSTKKELSIEEELAGIVIKNTRFANMCDKFNISILSTDSPQAKGRIERLQNTFQDRLYKELKKRNINTLEKANEFLINEFLPRYNNIFASPINNSYSLFTSVTNDFNFNTELAIFSNHKVYHNCYLKYNNSYKVIIDNNEKAFIPTSKSLPVYTFLDQTDHLLFEDKFYDLEEINYVKPNQVIKPTKTIEEINLSKAHKPPVAHPWRRSLQPVSNQLYKIPMPS